MSMRHLLYHQLGYALTVGLVIEPDTVDSHWEKRKIQLYICGYSIYVYNDVTLATACACVFKYTRASSYTDNPPKVTLSYFRSDWVR